MRLPVREEQTLLLLMEGLTYVEISGRLGLAPNTVKHIVGKILIRLRAKNATQAVVIALREGWVALDTPLRVYDPDYHNTGKRGEGKHSTSRT